jgi:hypothetical protein
LHYHYIHPNKYCTSLRGGANADYDTNNKNNVESFDEDYSILTKYD